MEDSQFYGMCHVRENVNQGPDVLNILRQSYDNAKVTIDFMTHNLQKHPRKGARCESLAKL